MDCKASQEQWNPLTKPVPSKLHRPGEQSKRTFLQNRANYLVPCMACANFQHCWLLSLARLSPTTHCGLSTGMDKTYIPMFVGYNWMDHKIQTQNELYLSPEVVTIKDIPPKLALHWNIAITSRFPNIPFSLANLATEVNVIDKLASIIIVLSAHTFPKVCSKSKQLDDYIIPSLCLRFTDWFVICLSLSIQQPH